MDLRIIELMKSARVPIEINVKPGQEVLVLADTKTDPLVWQAMAAATMEVGANATVAIIPEPAFHHQDPPPAIQAAIAASNIVVLCTTKGVIHAESTMVAFRQTGVKFIACEEASVDILMASGTREDNDRMEESGRGLERKLNEGKRAHLTSARGTDFTCGIDGRKSILVVSRHRPGGRGCSFPGGEVVVAPVENDGEGTVVWDVSMHHIGAISEPIVATFRGGRMVKAEGGQEARRLRDYLDRYGDENSNVQAELAFGLNPSLPITGFTRTDKKILGTCHVAIGMSSDIGGQNTSKTHLDGILMHPTLEIDGELIIENGGFKV